ncbi:MAG TPA: hypothetical protein GXX18_10005 [Bacillales bacterium]|nr:hypothetical protein [Bacillales bacterium]
MTIEELRERLINGEEFVFDFENDEYWISQNVEGIFLTRVEGSVTQEFKSVDELFENGTINSRPFKEAFTTFYF